ncbi:hypothetical protein FOZ62_017053, partial [Perkinsus olseni]
VPHTDYSTGTAEQILLLNQYIQQAAGVLADDNNVNSEATAAGGPAVPHEAHEDRSSSEAVVPSADPSGSSSAPPPPPTDTANDVVQAMLAASGMLDAANAAAAAAGVDPGNGQEIGGSMAPADANGDGDSGRPHKMQRCNVILYLRIEVVAIMTTKAAAAIEPIGGGAATVKFILYSSAAMRYSM